MPATSVDRDLIRRWSAARSLSRRLPPPVVDGEAVRVDAGLPAEERRYIFAELTPAVAALAATIDRPPS